MKQLLDAVCLLNVQFKRTCHRRSVGQRSFNIEDQTSITNGLCSSGSEDSNAGITLFEIREVYKQ
jgi:hypothetical protein